MQELMNNGGNRLASPNWPLFMPPLPEDEADLFDANPDYGHEKIERDVLGSMGVNADVVSAIYFGNWQRDFSQLIVPMFTRVFGARSRFVCNLIFEVVDVIAEAKFGRRLDRNRFGIYRWEEHIDNPRDYGIALNPASCRRIPANQRRPEDEPEAARLALFFWKEGRGAIQNYILASQRYVLRNLAAAMRIGPGANGRGLEYLGNALHTIEDFYAHSNFIELGFQMLRGQGDPMTGRWSSSGQPVRDSLGRLRLTTGVFLLGDTLVSLQKLLLHNFEGGPPGSTPSNMKEKIRRVLIRRLLGPVALRVYDGLMRALEATGIPALKRLIEQQIERALYPLRAAIAGLLNPLVEATSRQTGRTAFVTPGSTDKIIEMSHSRLSKDAQHHPLNPLARRLAMQAVGEFWRELNSAWRRGLQPAGPELTGTRFRLLLDRYMNHPQAVGNWWVPLLRSATPAIGRNAIAPRPARATAGVRRPVRPTRRVVRRPTGRPAAGPARRTVGR